MKLGVILGYALDTGSLSEVQIDPAPEALLGTAGMRRGRRVGVRAGYSCRPTCPGLHRMEWATVAAL